MIKLYESITNSLEMNDLVNLCRYSQADLYSILINELNDPKVWEAVRKSMTGQN